MFEKLLVPVDLSPQSQMMANTAARMASYGVREVVLYSALEHHSKRDPLLKAIDDRLGESGLKHRVVTEVRKDPASAILKAAEAQGSTMIAMAASGKGRVREFFVGSTSLAVIRRSKLPVLLDKFPMEADSDPVGFVEHSPGLLDSVLVTLDLSKATKHMMPYVQQLVDAGARRVTLLHVVQSSRYSITDERRFQEVNRKLEEHRSKLETGDCQVDTYVRFGTSTYNILESAREAEATLIMLGTTGKSYLRGATLGSTSEEVVKGSSGPVLLIPA